MTNNLDNLVLDDEATAINEAARFKRAGGDSLVELTTIGIGRNPHGLVRIAQATGLNIVMGAGYYVAPTHPAGLSEMPEEAIAETIKRDFSAGVGDTGVRAGVIGEIGCSWPLADAERKVLRAAAAAQRDLRCGLFIHPGRDPKAPLEILDVLAEIRVDVRRVVFSHIERTVQRIEDLKVLCKTGCYIEYDLFGVESTAHYPYRDLGIRIPSDAQRLDQLATLTEAGYGDQILMSHDICFKHRLVRYGGQGYEHILRNVVPWMGQWGFDDQAVRGFLVENPRRAIEIRDTEIATSPRAARG